ncbi:hypothetical protein LF1_45770 [Rubripirellula obstinata]|uniref:Uncharacterized protein n=1 Tax=Rubripirellula obstinata TaxID=406547 RepID=A0A5B1CN87_9BACT|nr:CinA family protein [Rubripirellula obstinata]KAA1262016.1 hypothetical protein LF1_45770 [Rubripirellula obstinata]
MSKTLQIALVISGGGTGVIGTCLRRPGASQKFVEAVVPYSRRSMTDYLGQEPLGPSASIETAQQMAQRAFKRAAKLSDWPDSDPVGVAMTCALPTVPPRNQVHQIHVAIHGSDVMKQWTRILGSEIATRDEAEFAAEQMMLEALAFLGVRY